MTPRVYTHGAVAILTGSIAPLTDTIKAMFLTSSYTPNIDTDQFASDINTNEVSSSGTGYTTGGPTLGTKAITQDSTNHRAIFSCADITVSSTTIPNYRYVAFYKSTGTPSTSPLLVVFDLQSNKSTNGDTAKVEFPATGAFYLSV